MALEKILGLVTEVVRYSDRYDIVSLFTRDRGRLPLLSASGSGRAARLRRSSLLPLTLISADVNFSASREIQYLGNFTRESLWRDLYFNPVKSAIAMFLSEFVNAYARQSPPDPAVWDYVHGAVASLDAEAGSVANFHLAFLIDFLQLAGIRPDLSGSGPGCWFDMRGGVASQLPPSHRDRIEPARACLLPGLSRMTLRTARLYRFNVSQRRELLDGLLKYYSIHFPGIGGLKSPEILAELFG